MNERREVRRTSASAGTWTRNANGNLCAKIAGVFWATVYQDKTGSFRFVRKHMFSREHFATERDACEGARRAALLDERAKEFLDGRALRPVGSEIISLDHGG